MATYGSASQPMAFTVPNLKSFIKLNPGSSKTSAMEFRRFNNRIPPHTHQASNLKVEGTPSSPTMQSVGIGYVTASESGNFICGFGNPNIPLADIKINASGTFNQSTLKGLTAKESPSELDIEQKPNHNLMPIMVFIGGR